MAGGVGVAVLGEATAASARPAGIAATAVRGHELGTNRVGDVAGGLDSGDADADADAARLGDTLGGTAGMLGTG